VEDNGDGDTTASGEATATAGVAWFGCVVGGGCWQAEAKNKARTKSGKTAREVNDFINILTVKIVG
jgi:hypothetical protein